MKNQEPTGRIRMVRCFNNGNKTYNIQVEYKTEWETRTLWNNYYLPGIESFWNCLVKFLIIRKCIKKHGKEFDVTETIFTLKIKK
jgi:hypothetical protein